jgi:S-adenosyl-L-methionine hydrolase (adenosine-forming)
MSHRPLITMTTDFGYDGPFIGVMKGVIYSINPDVNIVDLTHSVAPQNIRQAAFTIGMNYRYFPAGAIHLVIVDPGVGSSRRPLLVVAGGHYFIGPDNGVFSYLYLLAPKDLRVIHITSEHLFLRKDSPTFQGRDVFSPCAAWLSRDPDIGKFGEPIADFQTIHLPTPVRQDNQRLQGEVIFIDRFGNAITNIRKADIDETRGSEPGGAFKVEFKGRDIQPRGCYSEAEERGISALINSSGYLELFLFRGNAASEYGIASGDTVNVVFSSYPT